MSTLAVYLNPRTLLLSIIHLTSYLACIIYHPLHSGALGMLLVKRHVSCVSRTPYGKVEIIYLQAGQFSVALCISISSCAPADLTLHESDIKAPVTHFSKADLVQVRCHEVRLAWSPSPLWLTAVCKVRYLRYTSTYLRHLTLIY